MHSIRRLGGPHGLITYAVYRFGNWVVNTVRVPVVRQVLRVTHLVLDYCFVRLFLGAVFPCRAKIGDGLTLPHGGMGIVIHGNAQVGRNVTIMHQVTLGTKNTPNDAPTVGDNVFIGAGAKILGPVSIGSGAIIGANAVVLADVPPGATAVGVPAKIIPRAAH